MILLWIWQDWPNMERRFDVLAVLKLSGLSSLLVWIIDLAEPIWVKILPRQALFGKLQCSVQSFLPWRSKYSKTYKAITTITIRYAPQAYYIYIWNMKWNKSTLCIACMHMSITWYMAMVTIMLMKSLSLSNSQESYSGTMLKTTIWNAI